MTATTGGGGEDYVTDPTRPAQRSFMGELAHLFGALARVFSDPEVQKAGDNFMSAVDKAGARELNVPRLRMLDAPKGETPGDN